VLIAASVVAEPSLGESGTGLITSMLNPLTKSI
jgi:hypothetical protein